MSILDLYFKRKAQYGEYNELDTEGQPAYQDANFNETLPSPTLDEYEALGRTFNELLDLRAEWFNKQHQLRYENKMPSRIKKDPAKREKWSEEARRQRKEAKEGFEEAEKQMAYVRKQLKDIKWRFTAEEWYEAKKRQDSGLWRDLPYCRI